MGCFSGHLISAASDQKLFCKLCSLFCCSFDEFVEEKAISPSYSSAILTCLYPLKHKRPIGIVTEAVWPVGGRRVGSTMEAPPRCSRIGCSVGVSVKPPARRRILAGFFVLRYGLLGLDPQVGGLSSG